MKPPLFIPLFLLLAGLAAPSLAAQELLRFVALGDTGKGNEIQYDVARAMKSVCDARGGCAFALLLGDNVYQSGVDSPEDPQLQAKFAAPYANIDFPFYVVLGNHDYGGEGAGWEYWKARPQLEYTARNLKWRMPAPHYAFSAGPADFFALDTNAIMWGFTAAQGAALEERLGRAVRPWRIAFGHHPYVSNGKHGNAGRYDGVPCPVPGLGEGLCRVPAGVDVKRFMERHVCGKVDLYLAGHDHNLQDLGSACGTEHIVSGGGSSSVPLRGRNFVHFQAATPGFFLLETTATQLTATAFDRQGALLHERTLRKPAPDVP